MAIYVVEDDFAVADAMAYLLRLHEFDVFTFPDAEAFFAAGPPGADDVVIVDLILSGIGGAQIVRWLGAMAVAPEIIVVSGQPLALIERHLAGLKVGQILRKPLSRNAIMRTLEHLRDRSPAFMPKRQRSG